MKEIIFDLSINDPTQMFQEQLRSGENISTELTILLPEEYAGYTYILALQNNNGSVVTTTPITPVIALTSTSISYEIPNVVLQTEGQLKVEVNAYETVGTDTRLMKSAVIYLEVTKGLTGGTGIVPTDYVPWYVLTAEKAAEAALDRIATGEDRAAVTGAASDFITVTVPAAIQGVTGEGDTQVGRVTAEGDTQEQRVTDEGNTQVQRVQDEFPATVDELNERIDTIITTPISSEAAAQELIDARGGEDTLGDRFGGIDSQLAENTQQINALADNHKFAIVAGVIRNLGDGNGFQPITTGGHVPINILSVETLSDGIKVNYKFAAKNVISFVACPDEALAKKGFIMGTSVANNSATIMMKKVDDVSGYLTKSGGANPTFAIANNHGIASAIWDPNVLIITHEKCYNYSGISVMTRDPKVHCVVGSVDASGLKTYIKFYEDKSFGTNILFDGSNFVKNSNDTSDNSDIETLTWDSTNKYLIVNHTALTDNSINVTVSPKSTISGVKPYTPVVRSIASNYFYVEFYDDAGTLVTTPDAKCCFNFQRNTKNNQLIVPPDNTVIMFNRVGSGVVPPADVIYESSNIWLYGIMEIN